jgi:HAD superfamily phosphoserine phosphatase-like hydrolase
VRPVDLVAFDVDGTLVVHPEDKVVWHILAERFGGDRDGGAARFAAYRAGTMTYAEWVALDVGEWIAGGATREGILAAIRAELRLRAHAREVLHTLRDRGYHLAVISGTIDVVLDELFPDHPFAQVFTNRLRFDAAGGISGWTATPYDMEGKAEALKLVAAAAGVAVARCAFVGDHLNDVAALRLAGLPIACAPKHDDVRRAARVVLADDELPRLLELLP